MADRVISFAGGVSSILLVVFLAWLLSFLVGQGAAITRQARIGRGEAIGLVYGAHDTAEIAGRTDEVTDRIHGLRAGPAFRPSYRLCERSGQRPPPGGRAVYDRAGLPFAQYAALTEHETVGL